MGPLLTGFSLISWAFSGSCCGVPGKVPPTLVIGPLSRGALVILLLGSPLNPSSFSRSRPCPVPSQVIWKDDPCVSLHWSTFLSWTQENRLAQESLRLRNSKRQLRLMAPVREWEPPGFPWLSARRHPGTITQMNSK